MLLGNVDFATAHFNYVISHFLVNTMDLICCSSFQVDISCPGFREYHERLQTFLMWFIETASFIDVDDDHWDFFLVWVSNPDQISIEVFIYLSHFFIINEQSRFRGVYWQHVWPSVHYNRKEFLISQFENICKDIFLFLVSNALLSKKQDAIHLQYRLFQYYNRKSSYVKNT